ncbi:MAG: hypothetical protein ACI9H8_002328 [Lysobacterales bacterium]|jgi:uncharacterized protein (DUF885 family)
MMPGRKSGRFTLIAGLALLLAASLNGCDQSVVQQIGQPTPGAGEDLEALIQEYAQSQQQAGGRDPIFTVDSFSADIERQAMLLEKLRQVDLQGLEREQRTDRQLLIGLLETDIRTARVQRRWENDPAMYLPSRQIGMLMDPDAPESAQHRSENLSAVLAGLTDRIAQAKINLKHPPARFTEAAIFEVESTLSSVDKGAAAFEGLEVTTAITAARQLLEDYLGFLQAEVLPVSSGNWAIGKEEYDFILKHRWFMQADADDILARGLKAFEETEALAQEISERIQPGSHWTEVYETLKDDHPPIDGIKQAYQQQMDAAGRFVRDQQIVSLPDGESVITLDTPPAMRRSSPFGTFQSVSPFDEGLEGRLILTPIEDWMTPEQQTARLRSHHTAWIPIIAVHEAYPGHHVHALKTRKNPRILRKIAREPIFSEGWGLFTEELMFELGFLKGDDVRLTQLRNRLWRAARVILDSSLHTGKMTFEEAVDFLVEKVRFERYAAELEVGMYIRRPTYVLGYLIGMQELMAIRAEYIEQNGEPSPPSIFYDRLLSIGSIPPALVRKELLGRKEH